MERRDYTLDASEQHALDEWLAFLQEGAPDMRPHADVSRILRGSDGRIIVPVAVQGTEPALSLALLMGQKSELVYKQTGVRLQIAQRPGGDPSPRMHLWDGQRWHVMDWPPSSP